MRELAKAVENGGIEKVKGITFRKGDQIISNEPRSFIKDIDEIPFPSWDLLPMDKYQFYGERYAAMLTSRGCPFGCSFCASSRLARARIFQSVGASQKQRVLRLNAKNIGKFYKRICTITTRLFRKDKPLQSL